MRTLLLFLLLMPLAAGGSRAFSPEGDTAALTDFGGRHGFSLGLLGIDTSLSARPVDETQQHARTLALEADWSAGAFSIAVEVGRTSYTDITLSSPNDSAENFLGIRIGHAIATAGGSKLAAELRAYRYEVEGDFRNEIGAVLRWSRRF